MRTIYSVCTVCLIRQERVTSMNAHRILAGVFALAFAFIPLTSVNSGGLSGLSRVLRHLDDAQSVKKLPAEELNANFPRGAKAPHPKTLSALTRSGSKIKHTNSCPSTNLRVSLPQLGVNAKFSAVVNIRFSPSTDSRVFSQFRPDREYVIDILNTKNCWLRVQFETSDGLRVGWTSAKYAEFSYSNHLQRPNNRQSQKLTVNELYNKVASSTYMIKTNHSQGTAVAISKSVLITNCHVIGNADNVYIDENKHQYKARLIRSEFDKDKCFIRSLKLPVNAVQNVLDVYRIDVGADAYSVGAPFGRNRTVGKGIVSALHRERKPRLIQTSAPISPGSSGGGLFDSRGNLLGITAMKLRGT